MERPHLSPADLHQLREQTDWRRLFEALRLERTPASNDHDWWAHSPLAEDQTPSFHINDHGWYCFSTGQGGGVIELAQRVIGLRTGKTLNCFEAGHWLIEQGLAAPPCPTPVPFPAPPANPDSSAPGSSGNPAPAARTSAEATRSIHLPPGQKKRGEGEERGKRKESEKGDEERRENPPIRQTLLPRLQMEHPQLQRRGISRSTGEYLGCGYLEGSRSPLNERVVFQIRGVREGKAVILSHIGRATTPAQAEQEGKWKFYGGFNKRLELYNLDHALLDPRARQHAQESGHWLVVEGCFDVAKLVEAGLCNTVATFGAHLTEEQIRRLRELADASGIKKFRFVYDRDAAGRQGQAAALARLAQEADLEGEAFDWEQGFESRWRGVVYIPQEITDVGELEVEQLRWLRGKSLL